MNVVSLNRPLNIVFMKKATTKINVPRQYQCLSYSYKKINLSSTKECLYGDFLLLRCDASSSITTCRSRSRSISAMNVAATGLKMASSLSFLNRPTQYLKQNCRPITERFNHILSGSHHLKYRRSYSLNHYVKQKLICNHDKISIQPAGRFNIHARFADLSSFNVYRGLSSKSWAKFCEHFENCRDKKNRYHWYYNSLILGSSCVFFVLFSFYYLWKKGYQDFETWMKVATCDSGQNERPSGFDERKPDNHGLLDNTSIHDKKKIIDETHQRVDETDSLSFSQAVKKTEDLLKKYMVEVGSPGIVVCVSADGKYIFAKGFGNADVENQIPIQPHSVIRIASISKALTSAIIAKLCEEGKIKLDQSVYHYIPKFPEKHFLGEKVDITVRQLLNHTSGIRHYYLDNDPIIAFQPQLDKLMSIYKKEFKSLFYTTLKDGSDERKDEQDDSMEETANTHIMPKEYYSTKVFSNSMDALKMFSNDRLMAKPDTKYIYTTFGYTLLAAVIESVTKKSFHAVAKEALQLWGMKETYLDQHEPLIYNRVRHYEKKNGSLVNTPYVDVSYKWAGGGFLSSVMDVVKFGNILLYSSQHGDQDPGPPGYIKQSTVKEMWTSIENKGTSRKYGLGFEIKPSRESYGMCPRHGFLVGHTGAAVGASSALFILPRDQHRVKEDNSAKLSAPSQSTEKVEPCKSNQSFPAPSVLSSSSSNHVELPQGVVVAVIVNMIGVSVRDLTYEIANIFERVEYDKEEVNI